MKSLGLSLIIIGLLIYIISLERYYYEMIKENQYLSLVTICIAMIIIGVIISTAGYFTDEKPITENQMRSMLDEYIDK